MCPLLWSHSTSVTSLRSAWCDRIQPTGVGSVAPELPHLTSRFTRHMHTHTHTHLPLEENLPLIHSPRPPIETCEEKHKHAYCSLSYFPTHCISKQSFALSLNMHRGIPKADNVCLKKIIVKLCSNKSQSVQLSARGNSVLNV